MFRAVRLRDNQPSGGDHFLKLFGKPPWLQTCECERSEAEEIPHFGLPIQFGLSLAYSGKASGAEWTASIHCKIRG